MSRSRAKGTAWESDLRAYMKANGHPYCERMALGGIRDSGDLTGVPGWLIEAKNVRAIELGAFMTTAERKAKRLGVDPVLLIKRRSHSVARGYAVVPIEVWARLVGGE